LRSSALLLPVAQIPPKGSEAKVLNAQGRWLTSEDHIEKVMKATYFRERAHGMARACPDAPPSLSTSGFSPHFISVVVVNQLVPMLERGSLNFGHWLTMQLPRLVLAIQATTTSANEESWTGDLAAFHFLIYDQPYVRDALNMLDIAQDRVLPWYACRLYAAKKVLLAGPGTGAFATTDHIAPETANAIRRHVFSGVPRPQPVGDTRLKVLVLQRNVVERGRRIRNFEDVTSVVSSVFPKEQVQPFVCEEATFTEQIQAFHGARRVLGVDGACLANALWMASGGHLFVVAPVKKPDYSPGHPVGRCGTTIAWQVADAVGLVVGTLLLPQHGFVDSEILIPLDSLRELLTNSGADGDQTYLLKGVLHFVLTHTLTDKGMLVVGVTVLALLLGQLYFVGSRGKRGANAGSISKAKLVGDAAGQKPRKRR